MGAKFNARDYPSIAMIIDDIETILETSLQDSFDITRREFKVPLRLTSWARIYTESYLRTTPRYS